MTRRFLLALAPFVGAVAVAVSGVAVIVVATDSARAGATIPSSAFDSASFGDREEAGEVAERPIIASAYPFAYGDDRRHASDWVIVTKNPPSAPAPARRPTPPHIPSPWDDPNYGMISLCEAFGTHCDAG